MEDAGYVNFKDGITPILWRAPDMSLSQYLEQARRLLHEVGCILSRI
jgi:hypothetical protein